jgi:hypothetical protein
MEHGLNESIRRVGPLTLFVVAAPVILAVLALQVLLLGRDQDVEGYMKAYLSYMILNAAASGLLISVVIVRLSGCQNLLLRRIAKEQAEHSALELGSTLGGDWWLLRLKQDVALRPMGLQVGGGTIVVNPSRLVQVLGFLVSVFFVLINLNQG